MARPKISGELICTNCEYTYQYQDIKKYILNVQIVMLNILLHTSKTTNDGKR